MVKLVIVGRRAPGITRAAMKRYMLDVHGPLVLSDAELTRTFFARYRQNHVVDGVYGTDAPIGRDMVAQMELAPGQDPARLEASAHMREVVHPDEAGFAHLTDRVFTPVRDDVVLPPPVPAGRTEPARHDKVVHFLQATDGATGEPFATRWAELDGPAVKAAEPIGYVRNTTLPGPGGAPVFSLIAELWFPLGGGADGLGRWLAAVEQTGVVDLDRSFALLVTEHQLHPTPA